MITEWHCQEIPCSKSRTSINSRIKARLVLNVGDIDYNSGMYHCSRDTAARVKAQRLTSQCQQRPEFVGGVIPQEDACALGGQQPSNFPCH
jgi:hypothetical protein